MVRFYQKENIEAFGHSIKNVQKPPVTSQEVNYYTIISINSGKVNLLQCIYALQCIYDYAIMDFAAMVQATKIEK